MNQRLYSYHDTPLFFWLTPSEAGSYNLHYQFLQQKVSYLPLRDFERAIAVEAKIQDRIELLEHNETIPVKMPVDRTVPLLIVY